jgi:hypothetical protein
MWTSPPQKAWKKLTRVYKPLQNYIQIESQFSQRWIDASHVAYRVIVLPCNESCFQLLPLAGPLMKGRAEGHTQDTNLTKILTRFFVSILPISY